MRTKRPGRRPTAGLLVPAVGLVVGLVAVAATAAAARVGDPLGAFTGGPIIHQLQLTPAGRMPLSGALAGRTLYRFISDDRVITVDVVVKGEVIEQQAMYLPLDMRRGVQVSMFLQDAVGSVVGAQKGMIAFRAAVYDRSEKSLPFAGYTMRFTPLDRGMLRVLVTR